MVEKILNNTTPYGKIRASHEGSLHSSTLTYLLSTVRTQTLTYSIQNLNVANARCPHTSVYARKHTVV